MDWIGEQINNVKSKVVGPTVDPNTGMQQMNGQPQEKKPWWKFGFGGAKKQKTKNKKKKQKQTKYKRN